LQASFRYDLVPAIVEAPEPTMNATTRAWLTMDHGRRAVVLDQLLAAIPPDYQLSTRRLNELGASMPRFFHRPSGCRFSLVLGDLFERGMTEVRHATDDLSLAGVLSPERVPELQARVELLRGNVRPFQMTSCLVGDRLSKDQLAATGVVHAHLAQARLLPTGISALRVAFQAKGWRLPTEVEWEFVAHVARHALDDLPRRHERLMLNFFDFEGVPELCVGLDATALALECPEERHWSVDDEPPPFEPGNMEPFTVRRNLNELMLVAVRPWVSLDV
jgi:hypothetical protein